MLLYLSCTRPVMWSGVEWCAHGYFLVHCERHLWHTSLEHIHHSIYQAAWCTAPWSQSSSPGWSSGGRWPGPRWTVCWWPPIRSARAKLHCAGRTSPLETILLSPRWPQTLPHTWIHKWLQVCSTHSTMMNTRAGTIHVFMPKHFGTGSTVRCTFHSGAIAIYFWFF